MGDVIPPMRDFNREVGNHFQALAGPARGWFLACPGDSPCLVLFPQCWLLAASLSPGAPGGQPWWPFPRRGPPRSGLTQPGMVVPLCPCKRRRKPELPCPLLVFLRCACRCFPCSKHLVLLCPVPVSQLPSRLCLDKGGAWWRTFLGVLAGETWRLLGRGSIACRKSCLELQGREPPSGSQ